MPGNPLVRFDEGRVGRTARCRPLSYSTVRIFFETIHNADDAVFDERHLEVDEQAQTLVGEPKVCQKLFLVNRGENLYRLHFDNHFVFNDQVGPKAGIDANTLIDDRNPLLARQVKPPPA